jgi:hypothetical protein
MIRMPSSVSLQPLLDAIILNRHSAIRIPARHADRLDNFCLRHRDRPGIQGRLRRRRGSVRRQWRRRLKPAVNYNVTIVTCCLAAYPSPLGNHAFSNRQLSPTSTRNRAPADVTIQQSLPTNRGFIRNALSQGLYSNRRCELLEFAVTRRKQTTDHALNRHYFHPSPNANTPRSSRAGHELRTTNHESRIPPTHVIIKLSYARHRSLMVVLSKPSPRR